jgi:hypothetical protein
MTRCETLGSVIALTWLGTLADPAPSPRAWPVRVKQSLYAARATRAAFLPRAAIAATAPALKGVRRFMRRPRMSRLIWVKKMMSRLIRATKNHVASYSRHRKKCRDFVPTFSFFYPKLRWHKICD